jgi:hypothetical protein
VLIIGIDPATNTGVCAGKVGKTPVLSAHRWRVAKRDPLEDLLGRALFFMADLLRTNTPDVVAIEPPIRVSGGDTSYDTMVLTHSLYAVFAGCVRARGIQLLRADVRTWRRYFLGAGNLKGEVAKRESVRLCGHLGWEAPTHDAAEAAGIWLWACSIVSPKTAQRVEPLFAAGMRNAQS